MKKNGNEKPAPCNGRFVIQQRFRERDKWETLHDKGRFETAEAAKKALAEMRFPQFCRVAEEYTVIRYKAVN